MQWYGTRARDLMISIHAPREGCDLLPVKFAAQ